MIRIIAKDVTALLFVFGFTATSFAAPVITDLAAGTPTVNTIPLSWSVASGGPATAYELRYSTSPVDAGNFTTAVPLGGVHAPTGGTENHTVASLACGTKYWFAVMAYDAANSGGFSNIVSAVTAACAPSFSSSTAVSSASSLYAFTKGDFNNDGRQDLAFTIGSTRNIVFYPGNGVGGFGSPVTTSDLTGNYPLTPSAGDFNRDGKLDLAVPNFSSDSVSILLGDGAGGFTGSGAISTGDEPQDIAVNDFDLDGNPDIAVALWGGHAVAVYLGNGSGGFSLKANYGGFDGDARLNYIRAADLDGDGILDIVVADPGISPYRSNIGVLLGNGDGSFQDRVEYTVGNLPGNISIGDLNRDGKPDIIATSYSENLLAVFTGVGDGTFSGPTNHNIGGNAVFSDIADFNGDGISDIMVGRENSNALSLLTGKGDGSFNDPLSFPVGANIRQAVSDDFNGDGKPDVVALAADQATVYTVLNTTAWSPAGSFIAAPSLATGANPSSVKTADLNGDGRLDLVTSNEGGANADVFYGNGDGTFQTAVTLSAGFSPDALTIADFNRDARPDLLLINDSSSVYRYDNSGSGFSGPASLAFGINNDDVTSADVNRDGVPDLVLVYNSGDGSNSWAAVHLGDGVGGFGAETAYTAGSYANSVTAGDFNRDGITDLATGNFNGNDVSILLGKSDGTFHAAVNYGTGANPVTLATADFNGDGKSDLAVPNYGGTTVSVLMGDGDGKFQEKTDYPAGVNPQTVVVGDMDRDGRPDLVVASRGGSSIYILRGRGDGTFLPAESVAVGSSPIYPALGDFNGDGKTDIAVANYNSSTVSILLNTAPLPTVPQQGLAALWRGENNALDSIGGNHGANQGGTTYAAGKFGQAFSLDGEDDYIEIPNSPSLNPASAITVEAWYRPISFAGNGNNAIVSKGNSFHVPPYYEYHLGVNGDQYSSPNTRPGSFSFAVSPNNSYVYVETAANLWVPGNWYHLVGTYDGSEVKLYVNGVLQASQAASGTLNNYGKSVRIGAFNNISTPIDYTPGLIDEVAIYNRALSGNEIASMSAQVPNAFSFIDQTGVPINSDIVSNPITVTGINYPAAISITGGHYSVSTDGGTTWGDWTNAAGTVSLNNQVKVRRLSSAGYSATTIATLTIGGVSGDFEVTTAAAEDPDASGLISWWKGENNPFDSVGGNHGILSGGVLFAAGQVGEALSFDGADDYLFVQHTERINGGTEATYSARVFPQSTPGSGLYFGIFGAGDSTQPVWTTQQCRLLYWNTEGSPDGTAKFYMDCGTNDDTSQASAVGRLTAHDYPTGSWHSVHGVFNNGALDIYVNGVLDNGATSGWNPGTFINRNAEDILWIGAIVRSDQSLTTAHFNGLIDEVKIYDRALTAADVSKIAGTYPDVFSFSAKIGQALSTLVESDPVTVSGISQPAPISISGSEAEYEIGGNGTWLSTPSMVSPGATVKVRLTSSSSYLDTKTATLNIGGREGTFSVTTIADTVKPMLDIFSIDATESTTMNVQVSSLTASDLGGVTGYMITSSETPPLPEAPGWSATPLPMSITLTTAGSNTLYAWAKDPAGNVSDSLTDTVLLKPVLRGASEYYASIQTACGEAISGETVKALAATVPGSVTISGTALTIKGGHADGYGSQPGVTTIQGTLTIGTGSLTVDRVAVR